MEDNPFITIITASYNNASTIRETLDSVRNQTFKSIEHIVIDNCSTDGSLDILKDYKNTYNCNWLSEPDKGIADALNKGIHRSKGQYILALHADDRLLNPDTIEKIYPFLKNQTHDIVCFPIIMNHPEHGKIYLNNKPLWQMHFRPFLRHQGSFIHRRLHERIGDYNTDFSIAMDYDFFYRAVSNRAKITFGNEYVSLMEGNGVGTDKRYLFKRMQENYQAQKLNEKNPFWITLQTLYYYYKIYLRHILRPSFQKPKKNTKSS